MAASADGTVGKALEVLDQVAEYGRPVRFVELLGASDFPKATLYRLLQTLVNQRMLRYDPDQQTYAPGARLVRLAHAAWSQYSIAPLARPHIDRLSAQLGETVHLAQLDGGQVLYVDKRSARQPVQMFSEAGKVGPAYCTGVGKAMLAYLEPQELEQVIAQQAFHRYTETTLTSARELRTELAVIRRDGYSLDREEHETGIICVALPILSVSGHVIGGLSVTCPTSRKTIDELVGLVPLIRDTAESIAGSTQDWRFPEQAAQGAQ